jgi:hypothetical protein
VRLNYLRQEGGRVERPRAFTRSSARSRARPVAWNVGAVEVAGVSTRLVPTTKASMYALQDFFARYNRKVARYG